MLSKIRSHFLHKDNHDVFMILNCVLFVLPVLCQEPLECGNTSKFTILIRDIPDNYEKNKHKRNELNQYMIQGFKQTLKYKRYLWLYEIQESITLHI